MCLLRQVLAGPETGLPGPSGPQPTIGLVAEQVAGLAAEYLAEAGQGGEADRPRPAVFAADVLMSAYAA